MKYKSQISNKFFLNRCIVILSVICDNTSSKAAKPKPKPKPKQQRTIETLAYQERAHSGDSKYVVCFVIMHPQSAQSAI